MTVAHARQKVSEKTEIADIIAHLEVEARDREAGLYAACPSAFWLDPTQSTPLRVQAERRTELHQVLYAGDHPAETVLEPASVGGRVAAAAQAMIAAGPIFTLFLMLTTNFSASGSYANIMAALVVPIVTAPLTIIVGSALGLAPISVGVTLLSWLGTRTRVARERWLWSATGGAAGLALAGLFDAGAVGTAPLLITSAACATIAHRAIAWHDPEPA